MRKTIVAALLIVLLALAIGLLAWPAVPAAAHPKDRPDIPSYAHVHAPWGCHSHHYADGMLLDNHSDTSIHRNLPRPWTFCPHGKHLETLPVVEPTATPAAAPPRPKRPNRGKRGDSQEPAAPVSTPTATPLAAIPVATAMPTVVSVAPQVVATPDPRWAVDLVLCGAPGFAWNWLGHVHTIAEGHVVGLATSCEQAALVALEWMQLHLHRPADAPPVGEALDLGEHGCPGWLWSGDGLMVHPIEAAPMVVLGPAASVDDAIAMIAAWLGMR